MKIRLFLLLSLIAMAPAWAQQDEAERAQRDRIAAERRQADAAYQADEKACYRKFAVNDCLNEARKRRREVLADLRRQEISLNDAQRKRRAAEKLRSIDERSREQQGSADDRAKADAGRRAPEDRAAQKAAARASAAVSGPANAARREEQVKQRQAEASAARTQRDKDAAENVARQEKRLAEAQARREKLQKRLAEHRKPDAKPLPAAP